MKPISAFYDMLWVAAGGAIGASLRYGTELMMQTISNQSAMFTSTAIENILGSFAIGLVYTLLVKRTGNNHRLSLFFLTGLIGSYTTYSGFMAENLMLIQSDLILFAGYFVFQIGAGIFAAIIGIGFGKKWVRNLQAGSMP